MCIGKWVVGRGQRKWVVECVPVRAQHQNLALPPYCYSYHGNDRWFARCDSHLVVIGVGYDRLDAIAVFSPAPLVLRRQAPPLAVIRKTAKTQAFWKEGLGF